MGDRNTEAAINQVAAEVGRVAAQGAATALQRALQHGPNAGRDVASSVVTRTNASAPGFSRGPVEVGGGTSGRPFEVYNFAGFRQIRADRRDRLANVNNNMVSSNASNSSALHYTPEGVDRMPNTAEQNALRQSERSEADLRRSFNAAVQGGPAALRTRPVDGSINLTLPVRTNTSPSTESDGIVPQKDTNEPRFVRGYVNVDNNFGWPAGVIVESTHKYDLRGDDSVDVIPSEIVSTVSNDLDGDGIPDQLQFTFDPKWLFMILFAAALLLLILFALNKALSARNSVVDPQRKLDNKSLKSNNNANNTNIENAIDEEEDF